MDKLTILRNKFNSYRDKHDYTPGILMLRKALEKSSDNLDILYMLAELLEKRGLNKKRKKDLEDAGNLYNLLIKKYPKSHQGYFGKIRVLLRKKDKRALAYAKKYLKISKDKAYNMYIGHCYREFNDLKNAKKHYLLGYKAIKGHYGPDYALATLYMEMGDIKNAKKYAASGLKKYEKMSKKYKNNKLVKKYISELENIIKK